MNKRTRREETLLYFWTPLNGVNSFTRAVIKGKAAAALATTLKTVKHYTVAYAF